MPQQAGADTNPGERVHRRLIRKIFHETREAWSALSVYQRFEQVVSLILTFIIAVVIIALMVQLAIIVFLFVIASPFELSSPTVFQAVFGMVMTVLIALEFNHSMISVLNRKGGLIQVRTVVLIALLATVRKFIILDVKDVEPLNLVGLAFAVLALGGIYWLLRDQDRRSGLLLPPRKDEL